MTPGAQSVEWVHIFPADSGYAPERRTGLVWCGIPGHVAGTKGAVWVVPDERLDYDRGSVVAVATLTNWRTYAGRINYSTCPDGLAVGDTFADNYVARGLGIITNSAAMAAYNVKRAKVPA